MVEIGGNGCYGCGYVDTIWRSMKVLSENGKRPLNRLEMERLKSTRAARDAEIVE